MVSRVARNPVEIPAGVEVSLVDATVIVKGKQGELKKSIDTKVSLEKKENTLVVGVFNEKDTKANMMAGTTSVMLKNMVMGVTKGYECKLVLVGVGYRVKTTGRMVNLTIGFSHPVDIELPEGVTAEAPSVTELILKGIDKQVVKQIAADIRAVRPPEPYKGKGIRYANERVIQKEAKKK